MTIDSRWRCCNTRQRESEKTVSRKENTIVANSCPSGLPLDKSSRHGASGGAIHECPEKEAVVLHDAPGNTAPRCSRYLFCGCVSFGVLRSSKVRLVARIEAQPRFPDMKTFAKLLEVRQETSVSQAVNRERHSRGLRSL